jgi:hypothetical protein
MLTSLSPSYTSKLNQHDLMHKVLWFFMLYRNRNCSYCPWHIQHITEFINGIPHSVSHCVICCTHICCLMTDIWSISGKMSGRRNWSWENPDPLISQNLTLPQLLWRGILLMKLCCWCIVVVTKILYRWFLCTVNGYCTWHICNLCDKHNLSGRVKLGT